MTRYGYDKCDGDGCGVTSNLYPFPHQPGCKYGTGDRKRDIEIQRDAEEKHRRAWLSGPA